MFLDIEIQLAITLSTTGRERRFANYNPTDDNTKKCTTKLQL